MDNRVVKNLAGNRWYPERKSITLGLYIAYIGHCLIHCLRLINE